MDLDRPLPGRESLDFVEAIYARYRADPASVDAAWRTYFGELEAGPLDGHAHGSGNGNGALRPASEALASVQLLQDRVDQLVRAFRIRGHLEAQIDPLARPRPRQTELDPEFYGFRSEDLDRTFSSSTIRGSSTLTLTEIIRRLRATYCRSIGVQFQHIEDLAIKRWLERRMETTENRIELSRPLQLEILGKLTDAVIFEEFIQKKFLGAKSFSLEGAESLIPLLELAIRKGASQGQAEIVIGMAHRGRLNVLANIFGKSPRAIFHEFEDSDPELHIGRGDVKYHLGYSADRVFPDGRKLHLSLCFNPSHLEFVDPVVLGRVRAKQDRSGDVARRKTMALLIHGDAAFAGEGIIQETLNLHRLKGYAVGGTLHVIVNNQIGFTTDPQDARSSTYAADVARMLQVPIFHVNGEDPEAVAQVVDLAMDFRDCYQQDVVIDMYCYRRRGHNEGDEPAFTQPLVVEAIKRRPPVREGYLAHLLTLGGITREEADALAERRRAHLEAELAEARTDDFRHRVRQRILEETIASSGKGGHSLDPASWAGIWSTYTGGHERPNETVETRVARERLVELLAAQARLPKGFQPHPKIARRAEEWQAMARGERPLDWAAAEALAFATLLIEGCRVRMSGQDSQRGTFSHRHSVLHDIASDLTHMPLAHLSPSQAPIEIHNSPLAEASILGFEYGYSLDTPDGLVVWEAQFGDFVNCAQVIIDQFIVSAEDKWRRLSNLVMLLPHGFEGMGPEHSSARLERWLTMTAEHNIQVVNLTTPAQLFHCLRRQMLRRWRKPLVVMSPKSLLRHPRVVSSLDDLATDHFHKILPDERPPGAPAPRRVLLASGKVYYDLTAHREAKGHADVAILRVEQLYPLSDEEIATALAPYDASTPVLWVQEEPRNMGAWPYWRQRAGTSLAGHPLAGVHRRESASPATGSHASHDFEQEQVVFAAFAR